MNQPMSHKRGANRNELARKPRKTAPNFAQSRDIREDRGERQIKMAGECRTMPPNARSGR